MKSLPISSFEFGWLIGVLEGEGSFRWQSSNSSTGCQLADIGMTDEDTIYRIASLYERLGYKCEVKVIEPTIANRQDIYRIQLTGDRARSLMRLIVKHMSWRRRQQIWLSLNKQSLKGLRQKQGEVINLIELGLVKHKETA